MCDFQLTRGLLLWCSSVLERLLVQAQDLLVGVLVHFPRLAQRPATLDVAGNVLLEKREDGDAHLGVGQDDLSFETICEALSLPMKRQGTLGP